MIPANVIPDEILTDHPKRFRAMLIESENPAHSVADSTRMREALRALEFVVVIDVAMTESAREAHYVLPASSQYEKWEATFFGAAFHAETQYANTFTLRAPILDPLPGTLPEGEIHRRLVRAIGAMTDDDVAPLHAAAAKGRAAYAKELMRVVSERPHLAEVMTVLLYETLGPTLGAGNENAASVWGIAHNFARRYPESLRRAGFSGEGAELGEALFDAILKNRSGVVVSIDPYEETWRRIHGRTVNLTIPELMPELKSLRDEHPSRDPEFPFVLSAGQRRSSTANTIIRDPQWRPKDPAGALWMNPADGSALGVQSGGRVRIITKRASAESVVDAHRYNAARPRRAAERDRTVVPRPRRPGISAWRRAQRAHGDRGSRLVRGHAVSQARAGADRGGGLMRRTRFDRWPCPIARTTDLVGDWWTPLVMREAFSGRRRFEDFQRALKVPRAVLARRLDRLVDEGLLKKVAYEEHPPRYEYRLTDKGRAFWDVLAAMWRWGSDWLWGENGPPVILVDHETGREVRPLVVDENTGNRLTGRRLRMRRKQDVQRAFVIVGNARHRRWTLLPTTARNHFNGSRDGSRQTDLPRSANIARAPASTISELALFEPVRQRAIDLLRLKNGDRVLDVGCGTGLSFSALEGLVGPDRLDRRNRAEPRDARAGARAGG